MTIPATLHEALDQIADSHPDTYARFPTEGESITYRELNRSARALAADLMERGVAPGDRVGILCPNAPEFLRSLFAVHYAGAAACPLALPFGLRDLQAYPDRLRRITEVAGIRAIVVSSRFGSLSDELAARLPDVAAWPTEPRPGAERADLPRVDGEADAIVQFTSGSTAVPKGVRLTHGHVLAGLAAIRSGIALGRGDGGGFWLPLFHDMGLFGTLAAVLDGVPVHLWSPVAFVKSPLRWLREFLSSGATITAMPNFGYDQLLSAVGPEDVAALVREGLSMRHWRIAFNGAEPVLRATVEGFAARFAPAGFDPASMFTVYGMAEATLAVTFPPLGRPPRFDVVDRDALTIRGVAIPDADGRSVAAVGTPVAGMRLRVVDVGTGRELADREVGEVQIRGESVTPGYLAGAEDLFTDGWLRTGDLGYRRDGELYITGRRKEMITVRGINFYPQDVEAIARSVAGVYRGRCAAATGLDDAEEILLVAETALHGPEADALRAELRRRITAELGLAEVGVHLVAPRTIPRTSSGKIQRLATRELVRSNTSIGARHAQL